VQIAPRKKKVQQLVWLDPLTMMKVLKVADETGLSPNVVCAEIIKRYFEAVKGPFVVERPVEKVVEKVVSRAYLCPGCDELFFSVEEVKQHLKVRPDCLQRLRGMASA